MSFKLADFQINDLGFFAEASRGQLTRKPKEIDALYLHCLSLSLEA